MSEPSPVDGAAVEDLARVLPAPALRARIRARAEDFRVEEILGFEPQGEGPHAWLRVRKRGVNTQRVAQCLAGFARVPLRDVGYSGLKDRSAETTQWFSVNVEGREEPSWRELERDGVEVLEATRSRRKLRRGAARANRFSLVLREIEGDADGLPQRIERVRKQGVPNYFMEQRFGHEGRNLARARELLEGTLRVRDRHRRGLYLSAARSMLFNRVLSHRVARGTWDRVLEGDVMMLEGTHSVFAVDKPDPVLEERCRRLELHPTGPLCGRGGLAAQGDAGQEELEALAGCESWSEGLARAGLEQDRRALRARVQGLACTELEDRGLRLDFVLLRGSYATAVLRELIEVR